MRPVCGMVKSPPCAPVTRADADAGCVQSNTATPTNLIVAIDFTSSNAWAGKATFAGRNLHDVSGSPNPYELVLKAIAAPLERVGAAHKIHAYGFGDARCEGFRVFSLFDDDRPASGYTEVLHRYRQVVPHVKMAGPTNYAPVIQQAIKVVIESGMQHHLLLIIADGLVTRGCDVEPNEHSLYESLTLEALQLASELPLSVCVVGVGDGPWDTMNTLYEGTDARRFDNFTFVNYSEIQQQASGMPAGAFDPRFADEVLHKVPKQLQHLTTKRVVGGRPPFAASALPNPLPAPHVPAGLATIATRVLTPVQAARAAATIPTIKESHEEGPVVDEPRPAVDPTNTAVLPLPTAGPNAQAKPVLPLPMGRATQAVPVLPLPGTPPQHATPVAHPLGGDSPQTLGRVSAAPDPSTSDEDTWEEPIRLRPIVTVRHADMPRLRGHPTVVQASPFEGCFGTTDTPGNSAGHHSGSLLLHLDDNHNPSDIMQSAFASLDMDDDDGVHPAAAAAHETRADGPANPPPRPANPPTRPADTPPRPADTPPRPADTPPRPADTPAANAQPATQPPHPALASVKTVAGPLSNQLFYCPLTMDIMEDPVVAEDGRVYERAIIEDYIRNKGVSPFTRQPMSIDRLTPAWFLKAAIESARTEAAARR